TRFSPNTLKNGPDKEQNERNNRKANNIKQPITRTVKNRNDATKKQKKSSRRPRGRKKNDRNAWKGEVETQQVNVTEKNENKKKREHMTKNPYEMFFFSSRRRHTISTRCTPNELMDGSPR